MHYGEEVGCIPRLGSSVESAVTGSAEPANYEGTMSMSVSSTRTEDRKDEQPKSLSDRLFRKRGTMKATGAQAQRIRTSEDTTRLTVTLANSTVDAIELLADEMSLSKSAVINFLVGKGLVVEAVQSEGGIVQFLMPNGETWRLREFGKGGLSTQDVMSRLIQHNGEP